jgi:hypothetical protein
MQKRNGIYIQYEPNLSLVGGVVPLVSLGGNFTYLDRLFSFDMTNNEAKMQLKERLLQLLIVTDALKIRVQDKLKIVTHYIHSQVNFKLRMYSFPATSIEQSLDALCFRYVRKWKKLPVSACLKELFTLPKNCGGLGFRSFKTLSEII